MANKDNSERIERFLREQMSPEENDAFLNDLKNDKDLREEAQMMALMIKEMKEEQIKQSEKLTEDVLAEEKQAKKARIISMVRWPLSIAAMFILIFGATLLWNRQSDSEILFNEYYQPYVVQGERGGDDDASGQQITGKWQANELLFVWRERAPGARREAYRTVVLPEELGTDAQWHRSTQGDAAVLAARHWHHRHATCRH